MNVSTPSSLQGTHVVVFGGASGIGLSTAIAAKAQGADVTIAGRTLPTAGVAAQLKGARTVIADMRNRHSIEAVFDDMAQVDHLVITAASLIVGTLAESDPDHLLVALHERIAGSLYAIKAAIRRMPPTGSIVLTGGQYSDRPSGNGTAVIAAAVRGIEALARSLALELKPIRVNVISPGFIETPLFDAFGPDGRTAILKQAAEALPGGRVGTPDEAGAAIIFLLSNRYMNGEVLHIDGGGRFV